MKKLLSLLVCCFMLCGISFAEEETVEPRPYYLLPLEGFESKSVGISGDNFSVKPEGYCFCYDTIGDPMITFVFTVIPTESDMPFIDFPLSSAVQNDKDLLYGEPYGYDYSHGYAQAMTDPAITNGFAIPVVTFFEVEKDVTYHISVSYKLKNLTDDVSFRFLNFDVGPVTVSIPDDAFLEPAAQ